MSEGLRTQQANRVLNAINRGEISATQGLKALQFSRLEKSRGRTWLTLWLRFDFRTREREIRLLIPLIAIGPLILFRNYALDKGESFFALIKRGHYGVFHQLSKRHLQRYLAEKSTGTCRVASIHKYRYFFWKRN